MTVQKRRNDRIIAAALGIACLLVVGLAAWCAVADAYRADETGTSGTGVLPAILVGGFTGIALLTACVWFWTKSANNAGPERARQ